MLNIFQTYLILKFKVQNQRMNRNPNLLLINIMIKILAASLCLWVALCACPNPPPAAHFSIDKYEGLWYQIAKYQTAGGAYFQKDCKCTKIDVTRKSGQIYASQTCQKNGKLTGVNATLIPADVPGRFIEKISLNRVGYWVIQLDEQTAIQFDCGQTAGIRNYCIHIMSRHKTLPSERLKQLSDYALSLGLNSASLPMTITDQVNCNFSSELQINEKNLQVE